MKFIGILCYWNTQKNIKNILLNINLLYKFNFYQNSLQNNFYKDFLFLNSEPLSCNNVFQ